MEMYNLWLHKTENDAQLQQELRDIAQDEAAIEDRFYCELEFGTGGLRGILGAGTNRMNIYTVAKATQGFCNYLSKKEEHSSVAIGYDSRINSQLFAKTAAQVFAGNGIRVHLYSRLMPTPALSFAVRDLNCSGGIVVTASHNPAEYNGYKVYGSDGCQITTQAAKEIQKEIDAVDPFLSVKRAEENSELISIIGEDTVDRYLAAIKTASLLPRSVERDVAIVYTPLNGAGISCVLRCLKENGFVNITIPVEQRDPDGNFPTCPYPNPEVEEALSVGISCAKNSNSELLLATDPDCDRVGVAVKNGDNYVLISGNEMGVLLLDFICKMRIENGTMPSKPVAVKTIVTTPMAAKVAAHYGVQLSDVLTGFKYIGEQIGMLEQTNEENRYIFGFEESYGYLSGSFVRDKDAVNASLLICEMFAFYKSLGKSLLDVLQELYIQYGFYKSRLLSFAFKGSAGFSKMQGLMDGLRQNTPNEICGAAVTAVRDYLGDDTGLPKSNVIRFFLENDAEAVVRPSGTEPKLKVYVTAVGKTMSESDAVVADLSNYFTAWTQDEHRYV